MERRAKLKHLLKESDENDDNKESLENEVKQIDEKSLL